jgi:Fic family protein
VRLTLESTVAQRISVFQQALISSWLTVAHPAAPSSASERKAGEINALQRRLEGVAGLNHRQLALLRHALGHAGFRYTVLSHQRSHRISLQTARTDLHKLASRGWLLPDKDGRREVFRVPENLAAMLPR